MNVSDLPHLKQRAAATAQAGGVMGVGEGGIGGGAGGGGAAASAASSLGKKGRGGGGRQVVVGRGFAGGDAEQEAGVCTSCAEANFLKSPPYW